jgi:hypothetical protein
MARVGEEFPVACPLDVAATSGHKRRPAGAGSFRTGGLQAEEGRNGFARAAFSAADGRAENQPSRGDWIRTSDLYVPNVAFLEAHRLRKTP